MSQSLQNKTRSDVQNYLTTDTVQLDLADHFKQRIAEDATAQLVILKQN
jgi:hypothetical protein